MRKVKTSPKRKPPARKSPTAKKKTAQRAAPTKTKPIPEPVYSDEYREYLQRYTLAGEDRPRLSPKEFDRLDDELLDLLAQEAEVGLDDEQIIRLQELEYLLLDPEQ